MRLLFARRQSVLSRLSVVSCGTTSAIPDGSGTLPVRGEPGYSEPDLTTGKGRALAASPGARPPRGGESRLPPGVSDRTDMTVRRDGPPSRHFDLYGHYMWKFQKAKGDFWLTERVCAQAEVDVGREVRSNGHHGQGSNEDGRIRDARILEFHAGLKAWEVATFEDCDPQYVRRLRISEGLSPDDGLERVPEPTAAPSEEDRTARIVALAAKGVSQRSIADEVGLSRARVRQILGAP